MEIQIVPSLNEALLKEANKINARQGEEEQQREREDAKKRISRFKRANIIGLIIFLLLMFAIGWLAVWLKIKGIIP